ncbi:MAG: CRTAC1 family protein [Deltaproteobacteria bacterium]|nr:CRTAC1 family protein [Deltaproteobacteria bacterium]
MRIVPYLLGILSWSAGIPEFIDITETAMPHREIYGSFVSIRDFDNDGLEDILIDNQLLKNISYHGVFFKDVTHETGLSEARGHGTFIEIDGDTCPDIIFYGVSHSIQIYKNNCNGYFDKVNDFVGFENCIHTEAIGFIPHKNYKHGLIYCANYEYKDEYFQDYIYASNGDLTFYDVSFLLRSQMSKIKMPSRCVVSKDINNDNLVDFYVCNYRLFPNLLFMQMDTGEFSNEAININASSFSSGINNFAGSHTIGVSIEDLNNDGIMDIVVTNLAHNDYERGRFNKKSELLIFDKIKNSYVDVREISGIRIDQVGSKINGVFKDELFSSSVVADFNNDGILDIFLTQVYDYEYSFSKFFTGISESPYFGDTSFVSGIHIYDSLGSAYIDLNGDGCLDIVVAGKYKGELNRTIKVFENKCNYPGDFIQFKLSSRGYVDYPGFKIRVFLNDGQKLKVLTRGIEYTNSGFGQQNTETLHFGLGNDYMIDHIEIEWGDGLYQLLVNYQINTLNYISRPDYLIECDLNIIGYDNQNIYLSSNCNSDSGYDIFWGNSCEQDLVYLKDMIINKNILKGNDFCKDFVIFLRHDFIGVKKYITRLDF